MGRHSGRRFNINLKEILNEDIYPFLRCVTVSIMIMLCTFGILKNERSVKKFFEKSISLENIADAYIGNVFAKGSYYREDPVAKAYDEFYNSTKKNVKMRYFVESIKDNAALLPLVVDIAKGFEPQLNELKRRYMSKTKK